MNIATQKNLNKLCVLAVSNYKNEAIAKQLLSYGSNICQIIQCFRNIRNDKQSRRINNFKPLRLNMPTYIYWEIAQHIESSYDLLQFLQATNGQACSFLIKNRIDNLCELAAEENYFNLAMVLINKYNANVVNVINLCRQKQIDINTNLKNATKKRSRIDHTYIEELEKIVYGDYDILYERCENKNSFEMYIDYMRLCLDSIDLNVENISKKILHINPSILLALYYNAKGQTLEDAASSAIAAKSATSTACLAKNTSLYMSQDYQNVVRKLIQNKKISNKLLKKVDINMILFSAIYEMCTTLAMTIIDNYNVSLQKVLYITEKRQRKFECLLADSRDFDIETLSVRCVYIEDLNLL